MAHVDAQPILTRYQSMRSNGTAVLDYLAAAAEAKTCVESLPSERRKIAGIPADGASDRELVAKYSV